MSKVSGFFRLSIGLTIGGWEVIEQLHVDEAAEFYRVVRDNRTALLKGPRDTSPEIHQKFENESVVFQRMSGVGAPILIKRLKIRNDIFLLLEWIEGYSLFAWGAKVRCLPTLSSRKHIIKISLDLAQTYARLHQEGIVHNSVSPTSIKITPNGEPKLLQFSFASVSAATGKITSRFLLSQPARDNTTMLLSDLGCSEKDAFKSAEVEERNVGMLIYFLCTGKFSTVSEDEGTSIADRSARPMVPFRELGIASWPAMEELLCQVLEIEQHGRLFLLLHGLSNILERELFDESAADSRIFKIDELPPTLRSFAKQGKAVELPGPNASINYGAAGIAYALFRYGVLGHEPSVLSCAAELISYAKKSMRNGQDGFFNVELGITQETVGAFSLMHRGEGVYLVQALLAHAAEDKASLEGIINEFLINNRSCDAPLEFACGRAGILNLMQQLAYLLPGNDQLQRANRELAAGMMSEIESTWSLAVGPVSRVGFAHGWAGILYTLLSWAGEHESGLIQKLLPFLAKLRDLGIKTSLGTYWRKNLGCFDSEAESPSWCNGSAGLLLLWTKAFEVTRDSGWLRIAREAALHVSSHQYRNTSICCGLAGRALALGNLFRASGDEEWLDCANRCLERAESEADQSAGYPGSLFTGRLGVELARVELAHPNFLIFPTLAKSVNLAQSTHSLRHFSKIP